MTKTSSEVIARAHRRIRVLAHDEPLTAEMVALGSEMLTSLFAELQNNATIAWTVDTVPDDAFLPLAHLLAVDISPDYNRPLPETRGHAFLRLMEVLRPDDTEDRRDVDGDGLISEAEEYAGKRATFF